MKFFFEQGIVVGVVGLVVMVLIVGVLLVDYGVVVVLVEVSVQIQVLLVFIGDVVFCDDVIYVSVVFVGGCFWGVQGVFQYVKGVNNVVFGYIGGSVVNVCYECVSGGQIGYVEVVKIDYDLCQVSYGQLMQVFFLVVYDLIQFNCQGLDYGSQYCLVIFSDDVCQQVVSCVYIVQFGQVGSYCVLIVIQLVSGQCFYLVESYYQNYMINYLQVVYICYYDVLKLVVLVKQFLVLYWCEVVLVLMC